MFLETGQYRDGVACLATLVHRADDGTWALGTSHRTGPVRRLRDQLAGAGCRAASGLGAP